MTEDNLHTTCTNYFRNSTLTRQQIYELIRPEEYTIKDNTKFLKIFSAVSIFFCLVYAIGIYQCVCWVIRKRKKDALKRAQSNDAESKMPGEVVGSAVTESLVEKVETSMTEENLHTTCTNYFRKLNLTRQQIYDLIRPEEPAKEKNTMLLKLFIAIGIFFGITYTIGMYQAFCWVTKKRKMDAMKSEQTNVSQKAEEEKNEKSLRLPIDSAKEKMA
ncbi:unnamed protein product [Caenorhabditis brenneri]